MGWYIVVSLLTDSRVRFLMGFVIVAVILAIVLILIEIMLKEKDRKSNQKLKQMPGDRVEIYIESNKSVQDKLEFIDKTAKEYFNDMYDLSLTASYSSLVKELEKKGKKNEIEFCKEMFAAFYSKKGLDKARIKMLGKMLIEIEGHRTVERKAPEKDVKEEVSILGKGAEEVLGVKKVKTDIKNIAEDAKLKKKMGKAKGEDKNLLRQEALGVEEGRKAEAEELHTKRRLEVLGKQEARQREKEKDVRELKKQSEVRIVERKRLVDERLEERAKAKEERERKEALALKEKEDKKKRKKEEFWKAKSDKEAEKKRKEIERDQVKKLAEEKQAQEEKERREIREVKIEQLKERRMGLTKEEQKRVEEIDVESEGIAEKIVRLEKARLESERV